MTSQFLFEEPFCYRIKEALVLNRVLPFADAGFDLGWNVSHCFPIFFQLVAEVDLKFNIVLTRMAIIRLQSVKHLIDVGTFEKLGYFLGSWFSFL